MHVGDVVDLGPWNCHLCLLLISGVMKPNNCQFGLHFVKIDIQVKKIKF